jgi:hypothetical protein
MKEKLLSGVAFSFYREFVFLFCSFSQVSSFGNAFLLFQLRVQFWKDHKVSLINCGVEGDG